MDANLLDFLKTRVALFKNISEEKIDALIEEKTQLASDLLDGGATVPFVAPATVKIKASSGVSTSSPFS